MSFDDYGDYPLGDQDSHKKHMRHLKALKSHSHTKKHSEAMNKAINAKKSRISENEKMYRKGEKTLAKLTQGIRKGYM